MQVASFVVGGQEYALDIMQIVEIINPIDITVVPKAPVFIEGIIELRGAVLPVVDLRKRFALASVPMSRESKYIIVTLEGHIVGLIVDRVREVMRIDEGEILEAPAMATGVDARFIGGVFKRDERMILTLEIAQILSSSEKSVLDELGASGE